MEVDIVDQLQEYEKVREENKAKREHWKKELDKIRKLHQGMAPNTGPWSHKKIRGASYAFQIPAYYMMEYLYWITFPTLPDFSEEYLAAMGEEDEEEKDMEGN